MNTPDPFGIEPPSVPAAVQADDALLDKLRAGQFDSLLHRAGVANVPISRTEYELTLARVLGAWRRDVGSEPAGELVDTDRALVAIQAGYESPRQVSPVFTGLITAVLATAIWLAVMVLFLVAR